MRQQSHRERVLWEIALNYHDLVDQLGGGFRETDTPVIGMNPTTYTPTVREFERLAKQARTPESQHVVYDGDLLITLGWHLLEYAIKAEPKIRLAIVTVKKNGKTHALKDADRNLVKRPERAWRRHPAASETLAKKACSWMAEEWDRPFEPELPQPFLEPLLVA